MVESAILAQPLGGGTMELDVNMLVSTIVYAALGMGLMAISFKLVTVAVPFCVRKEIEEDQNVALAVIVGSVFLGIAIIIAASING
jgi:uncharacterized membrane protein YjfL (UPF0719 family)